MAKKLKTNWDKNNVRIQNLQKKSKDSYLTAQEVRELNFLLNINSCKKLFK